MSEHIENIGYRITANDRDEIVNQATKESTRGIFRFDKPITEDIATSFSGFVLDRVSRGITDSIYLVFNTPGGHVTDGYAIYDDICALKEQGCTVYGIATGLVASMGAFLFAGCSKGYRYCSPNAEILLHQPLGGVAGQASDMVIVVNNIVRTKERLLTDLAKNTGQAAIDLAPKLERDYIMSASESISEGVADKIDYLINIIGGRSV
jgi:ATP-dependent Clp protease protease subunit